MLGWFKFYQLQQIFWREWIKLGGYSYFFRKTRLIGVEENLLQENEINILIIKLLCIFFKVIKYFST